MTVLLEIDRLTAGYGGAPVVRNLVVTVGPGEVVALLGPNGAGKTTTLRAVSGLVQPMSGAVRIFGRDATKAAPYRIAQRGVAHVAEGRSIFFGLTVAEHFKLRHAGERLDVERAYSYLPQLRDITSRRAGVLSGGEQQMLALARALARNPKILLVDELSLGLAPIIVRDLLRTVREYASDSGAAVLLVEQHVDLALDVADRAYVMSHGEIVLDKPANELRHDRALLTASYLGESQTPESAVTTTTNGFGASARDAAPLK